MKHMLGELYVASGGVICDFHPICLHCNWCCRNFVRDFICVYFNTKPLEARFLNSCLTLSLVATLKLLTRHRAATLHKSNPTSLKCNPIAF